MGIPLFRWWSAVVFMPLLLFWQSAFAHPLAPSLLRITQLDEQSANILWKQPAKQSRRSQIKPVLPDGCSSELISLTRSDDGALEEQLQMHCRDKLAGLVMNFSGLENADTYILVETIDTSGRKQSAVLNSADTLYRIPVAASLWSGRIDFVKMGFHHLLTGMDHMLFILGLSLLLMQRARMLVLAFTAFTAGHTMALFGAWFGWLTPSHTVVEPLIVISLIWMALEIFYLDQKATGISLRRWPFLLTLVFGLIHGSGFAGSLLNQLVPGTDAVFNILAFNIGLELGQIAVVVAVLLTVKALGPQLNPVTLAKLPRLYQAGACGIGGISCYWLLKLALG